MKWNEPAVAAAIQALPPRTDGKSMDIDEAVDMMRLRVWGGSISTLARARTATRKQTLAELKKLCDLCRELHEHIGFRMHSPALRMVEASIRDGKEDRAVAGRRPLYHPLVLNIQLEGMFEASRTAWLQAQEGCDLPQPAKRGTKPGAKDVTTVAASVFEAVTGRSAARSYSDASSREGGAFLGFLTAVFDALEVNAKPARQLRMEKSRPKRP